MDWEDNGVLVAAAIESVLMSVLGENSPTAMLRTF